MRRSALRGRDMQDLSDLVERVSDILEKTGRRLAVAESCTGGLLAAALTERPGSSVVFECGFVTYSNEAKIRMLGVSETMLDSHGAVSAPVAAAMARGALTRSGADLSVSVTGIAGPAGGSAEKPVGLVFFGFARKGGADVTRMTRFTGDRGSIRGQAVRAALSFLVEDLELTS